MATLINNAGVQHYANKMVLAENRKVGSKSLPTALNDIDNLIDEMKTHFDAEYGSALDMKLNNNENVFSVGTGADVDKGNEVENSFTDIELSGNSLVNLWAKRNGSANLNDVVNNTNNEYVGVIKAGSDCGFTSHISNIKSDTYTVIFDLKTDSTLAKPKIMFFDYGGLANAQSTTLTTSIPNTNWNTYILTRSVTKTNGSTVLVGVNCPSSEIGIKISVRNVMILQGDWTNKPVPQYFQGLKSVGERGDGNHKISISSVGKNLLNIKDFKSVNTSSSNISVEYKENKIILTSNNTSSYTHTSVELNLEQVRGKSLKIYHNGVKVTNNTNQRIIQFNILKEDGSYSYLGSANNNTTVTIPVDSKKVSLCIYTNNSNTNNFSNTVEINELMICYADTSQIPYEPHKSDKKEISLNEPLRGLPNGVKDTIEKINGEWKIVRRCKQTTLTGDSLTAFTVGAEGTSIGQDVNRLNFILNDVKYKTNSTPFICDKFSYVNFHATPNGSTERNVEGACFHSQNSKELNIHLLKTKLSEQTSAGAKSWLNSNPVTVIYELENYITEDISPVTLQCWKNGTISVDEVLPVESTHMVALNKPAQIKRNIEELTALRKRVQALEDFYDQVALEQSHQLSLINHSIELDYDI